MQPLDYVILFVGSYFSIGLLGIQSKNVQKSKYFAAGFTSMLITLANAIFVKYMATGGVFQIAIAGIGASCGIMSSIWFYDNVLSKKNLTKEQTDVINAFRKNNVRLKKNRFGGWSLNKPLFGNFNSNNDVEGYIDISSLVKETQCKQ